MYKKSTKNKRGEKVLQGCQSIILSSGKKCLLLSRIFLFVLTPVDREIMFTIFIAGKNGLECF